MGLLGSHEEGEASHEQACAEAARGTVQTRTKEEGDQQLPPEDNSGSESESGAETDDEASSASDYPPHLTGQPAGVAASMFKGHEIRLSGYNDSGERDATSPRYSGGGSRCEEITEELSHLDPSKESSSVGVSAACPSVTTSFEGASGTSPSLPTIQLPPTHAPQGSSGDESNGGNEPDVSASGSETSPSISTNSYLYGQNASDRVRHLVKRSLSKKRKQQQREGRPKRETKTPLVRGRRSKKSNRNSMKHNVDATLF